MKRTYEPDVYPVLIDVKEDTVVSHAMIEIKNLSKEEEERQKKILDKKLLTIQQKYAMRRGTIGVRLEDKWADEYFDTPCAPFLNTTELVASLYPVIGASLYMEKDVSRTLSTEYFTFECYHTKCHEMTVMVTWLMGGFIQKACASYSTGGIRPYYQWMKPREYNEFDMIHPDIMTTILMPYFLNNTLLEMMLTFAGCAADRYLWNTMIKRCNCFFLNENFRFDLTSKDVQAYYITSRILHCVKEITRECS